MQEKNHENKKYETEVGGKKLSVSFINLAEKANGEALVRCGDTVILATATMSEEETNKDFFPLSVSYEEKFYAAGKISGPRYTRREGRPSDRATLVSRMIDRAIRPCFPEGVKKEIQVIVTCLSFDEENDPGIIGMIAASLALHISNIPWEGPLGAVKIGKNDNYKINPGYGEKASSSMEIVISGFLNEKEELITNMIEGTFNEESEEDIVKVFDTAQDPIKELCLFQEKIRKELGKEKAPVSPPFQDEKVEKEIREKTEKRLEEIFKKEGKEEGIKELKEEISSFIKENYEEEEKTRYAFVCLEKIIKEKVRKNILEKGERLDGRKEDEVREIECSVGILPRTHGPGVFRRGQTKSLSVITLGAPGEQQLTDGMEASEEKKRFMHHYNFPPYSVGEVKPIRGPGRREIGHGMIGENAIAPLIPDSEKFPYTIRAVSEIVSSNGSTSMASVCGTTLALMDAGVPLKRPAAGISVGLITGKEGEYKLLTDIQGMEDHFGDMDFKVAGTEKGVTVIQLDVKIRGINKEIIEKTLEKAKKTRSYLLEKITETIPEPRKELSPFAPRIVTLKINPEKIGEVIGPKGKTINEIIESTEVSIDIDDSGIISISSEKEESIRKAIDWIKNLTREVKKGEVFQGKVIKILGFGAVVEIFPGQEGLVHISEIADYRVKSVEDEVSLGEVVPVKAINVESGGKISLSIKEAKKEISS